MTDFEYILQNAKLFHYKGWEAGELRKCIDLLPNLTREELLTLYSNRWLDGTKSLTDEIFKILMGDEVDPRREFIQKNAKYVKNLDI